TASQLVHRRRRGRSRLYHSALNVSIFRLEASRYEWLCVKETHPTPNREWCKRFHYPRCTSPTEPSHERLVLPDFEAQPSRALPHHRGGDPAAARDRPRGAAGPAVLL